MTSSRHLTKKRRNLRWLPSAFCLIAGSISAVLTLLTTDLTWRAVWIGVCATAVTAGLVDVSAVYERHRQLAPLRRIAARRFGRVTQIVLSMIETTFGNLKVNDSDSWIQVLRERPDSPLDLSTPANVYPPRSRAAYLGDLAAQLRVVREELASYVASAALPHELETLDRVLQDSMFLALAQGVFPIMPQQRNSKVISDAAAELLEQLNALLPFARESAGDSWRYGDLSL